MYLGLLFFVLSVIALATVLGVGPQLPGLQVGLTKTPRDPLFTRQGLISGSVVLDGSTGIDGSNTPSDEIRAGWFLGRITATNLWVPCKRTKTSGGATSASVTVDDASAFRAGDTISVGADTGLTVDSVDYGTNTIVLSGSITFVDDEAVVAEDGSQTARAVLLDFAKLRDARNENDADQLVHAAFGGGLNVDILLGDVSEIRADASALLDNFVFSDDVDQ